MNENGPDSRTHCVNVPLLFDSPGIRHPHLSRLFRWPNGHARGSSSIAWLGRSGAIVIPHRDESRTRNQRNFLDTSMIGPSSALNNGIMFHHESLLILILTTTPANISVVI